MALYYFAAAVLHFDVRIRQFRGQFVRQYSQIKTISWTCRSNRYELSRVLLCNEHVVRDHSIQGYVTVTTKTKLQLHSESFTKFDYICQGYDSLFNKIQLQPVQCHSLWFNELIKMLRIFSLLKVTKHVHNQQLSFSQIKKGYPFQFTCKVLLDQLSVFSCNTCLM